MITFLSQNPLLLLFTVAGLGYLIGSIRIGGAKLGVAAVLFVGLGIGALDPALKIPEIVLLMGLAIFVYSIGLSSGPGFFGSFRKKAYKELGFILAMILFHLLLVIVAGLIWQLSSATTAGIYAGTSTSTAALAGLLNAITQSQQGTVDIMLDDAVIGYSLAYPMGVLGVMLMLVLMEKLLRIDLKAEQKALNHIYPINQQIENASLRIDQEKVCHIPLRDLKRDLSTNLVFGRIKRGDETFLSSWGSSLEPGDYVRVAGSEEAIAAFVQMAGSRVDNVFQEDDLEYQHKRVFVSNPEVAGKKLGELNLDEKFAAVVSRIRRGDSDLLAQSNTVLELGDRIRFIARRKDVKGLMDLFGDSYHALSHINLFSFGLGMAMGLILGMVVFELPGGLRFQLGYAGGPLIVAMILGNLRRTGSIVWTLPYGANLTLRQIGLIFLLAGIGIRSGHTFFETFSEGGAGWVFLAGTAVSMLTVLVMVWVGYRMFRIPFTILMGMFANQPAILDFVQQRSKNQLPGIGYGLMFPLALIAKILLVQLLFLFFP
ncbi:MAG: TrkA C-terminal domain-containing protein [Bacteroidota bacterium]